MRMIRGGHYLTCKRGAKNEVRFVNSLSESPLNVRMQKPEPNCALRELMQQNPLWGRRDQTKELGGPVEGTYSCKANLAYRCSEH